MERLSCVERTMHIRTLVRETNPARTQESWRILVQDILLREAGTRVAETWSKLSFGEQEAVICATHPSISYGTLRTKILSQAEEALGEHFFFDTQHLPFAAPQ